MRFPDIVNLAGYLSYPHGYFSVSTASPVEDEIIAPGLLTLQLFSRSD